MVVDMETWRSIDYEGRLKRELKLIESSPISEGNKMLIRKFMNHRLARGVSVARTHREISLLRLLCERFNADLENLNKESVEEILASVEIAYRPNTVNEFKKALKYFLKFQGKK